MGADRERLWVLQATTGNQEAFARLVEAYQVPVYNLAFRMLGNESDAEDAAQETFLRVYTKLGTYDPNRKFSTWVLSIASHYCVDRLRRRRGDTVSAEQIDSWRWIPDQQPRPEEQTLKDEKGRYVRLMLAELPPQYRLAIILRYWYSLSYEEIAQITLCTQSAVKSRLHRARQMMASKLEQSNQAAERTREGGPWRESENALSRSF